MNIRNNYEAPISIIRKMTEGFLTDLSSFPVSYCLDGTPRHGIPVENSLITQEGTKKTQILAPISVNGLSIRVELITYEDFPVVEWTIWISNTGSQRSERISELCGADILLKGKHPVVVHNNSDTCDFNLFTESDTDLAEARHFEQRPQGGRSSDCALPYSRVLCEGFGYNLSVGWCGQWETFYDLTEDGFRYRAKQQYTDFRLNPGETVRTPRITVMLFNGGRTQGMNMWRHFMTDHVIPRPGGNLIPAAIHTSKPSSFLYVDTVEDDQTEYLDRLKEADLLTDGLWLDAGWYDVHEADGSINWRLTGDWTADPKRFPNGLTPIGEKCRELGMDFLLWFEPERVMTRKTGHLYREGWLLELKDPTVIKDIRIVGSSVKLMEGAALLNLGNRECCDYIIETIDRVIKEYKVTIYRQDMNFAPLNWWIQNDEKERIGINENFYVQGLLYFWDEILRRNPGLWINSVASGGKRLDMEILRRSVLLHQSDFAHGHHPIHQCINTFTAEWLVYGGGSIQSWDDADGNYRMQGGDPENQPESHKKTDNFSLHNVLGLEFRPTPKTGLIRKLLVAEPEVIKETEEYCYFKFFRDVLWKRAVPYMYFGDFYLLSASDRTNTCWYAVQFHEEEKNEGFFQVIRNTKSPDDTFRVFLREIDSKKMYLLESPEFSKNEEVSGTKLLSEGFSVSLPKRTGEIWFYKALDEI